MKCLQCPNQQFKQTKWAGWDCGELSGGRGRSAPESSVEQGARTHISYGAPGDAETLIFMWGISSLIRIDPTCVQQYVAQTKYVSRPGTSKKPPIRDLSQTSQPSSTAHFKQDGLKCTQKESYHNSSCYFLQFEP